MAQVLATGSAVDAGQLVIVLGAITAFLGSVAALVMLGPNRNSKAMEIAESGIDIAGKRATAAEEEEAQAKAELVLSRAREEALQRKLTQLRARLREAGLDDS